MMIILILLLFYCIAFPSRYFVLFVLKCGIRKWPTTAIRAPSSSNNVHMVFNYLYVDFCYYYYCNGLQTLFNPQHKQIVRFIWLALFLFTSFILSYIYIYVYYMARWLDKTINHSVLPITMLIYLPILF